MNKKLPWIILLFAGIISVSLSVFLLSSKKTQLVNQNNNLLITPNPTDIPEEIKTTVSIETKIIIINNEKFTPETISIKTNDQIAFKNESTEKHLIKGDTWRTIPMKPGMTYFIPFKKSGNYPYICTFHPQEKGIIIVN